MAVTLSTNIGQAGGRFASLVNGLSSGDMVRVIDGLGRVGVEGLVIDRLPFGVSNVTIRRVSSNGIITDVMLWVYGVNQIDATSIAIAALASGQTDAQQRASIAAADNVNAGLLGVGLAVRAEIIPSIVLLPVFLSLPLVIGIPHVGQALSDLTYTDGTVSNGSVIGRTYLLNGAPKPISYVLTDADVGASLVYRNTAAGGVVMASSAGVAVEAAPVEGGGLQRLTTSAILHINQPTTASLGTLLSGSTVNNYPGTTATGAGATRALSGTPTARSALLTEMLGSTSRASIIFAPDTAPRTMKIGVNMAGLAYYYVNNVWLDYMKPAGVGRAPATVDANNMPLTLNAGRAEYYLPLDDASAGNISYTIVTDGVMTLEVIDSSTLVKTSDGYTFDYHGGGCLKGVVYFVITGIQTSPTKMAVVRTDELPRFKSGKTFKQSLVDKLAGFAYIRDLNWSGVLDQNPLVVTPDSLFYSQIVPLSVKAKLSRETGIPLWLCQPMNITDAQYQANFPTLDGLVADGLTPIIEYGNEIWNVGNYPWTYGRDHAPAAGYSGGEFVQPLWWSGYRGSQLAKLSRGRNYRSVWGGQPVQSSYQYGIMAQGQQAAGDAKDSDFWGWITTNYNKGTLTINPGGSLAAAQSSWVASNDYDSAYDNIANSTNAYGESAYQNETVFLPDAKSVAVAHGWKLLLYEFNCFHLNAQPYAINIDTFKAFFHRLQMQPQAKGLMNQNLEGSQANGVYMACVFDLDSIGDNQSGNFGVLNTPSFDAITDWLAAGAAVAPVNVITTAGYRYWRLRPTATRTNMPVGNGTAISISELYALNGASLLDRTGWTVTDDGTAVSGGEAYRVFDGSTSSNFYAVGNSTGGVGTLIIDAKTAIKPTAWRFISIGSGLGYTYWYYGYFEGSNDLSTWTIVGDFHIQSIPPYSPDSDQSSSVSDAPMTYA